jgi:hypothetical protein
VEGAKARYESRKEETVSAMSGAAAATNKFARPTLRVSREWRRFKPPVMAGLVPAIHEFVAKTWMPGTSRGMTLNFLDSK